MPTEVGGRFSLEGKHLRLDWARAPPGGEKVLDGQPNRENEQVPRGGDVLRLSPRRALRPSELSEGNAVTFHLHCGSGLGVTRGL